MSKTLIVGSISPSLLAFKPRQVLLSQSHHNMKPITNSETLTLTLEPHQRTLLHQAVAFYLDRHGFSKTLKKFRSEAQIEKDFSDGALLNLEDMCFKYLKKCNQANTTRNKQEMSREVADDREPEPQEQPTHKYKDKKKIVVSESRVDTVEKDQPDSQYVKSVINSEGTEPSEKNTLHEEVGKKSKDKKKKKNKQKLECISDNLKSNHIAVATNSGDANVSIVVPLKEKVLKSKTKKKRDGKHLSDEISNGAENENGGIQTLHKDECNENHKKRKRLASVELDSQPADEKKIEDVKRRKMEGSKGCDGEIQSNAATTGTHNLLDEQTNDNVETPGVKISSEKTMRKLINRSVEPTSVNAFQRVKVDAVVFADEKLTDNSYWAKGGADSGYGAKAQEVLGQVKGRGFRHEKTKKKRGSYRGGVIDQQSHSVKFNYSDDE